MTTSDTSISTAWFTHDARAEYTDVDHPLCYYDPNFKQFCLARLDELACLQPDWDQEGAPAIDPAILVAARGFIEMLPRFVAVRPMVVPLTSGALQFEWHKGRTVLELEFETDNLVHYLKWDPDREIEEEATLQLGQRERLVSLIRWFMERFLND